MKKAFNIFLVVVGGLMSLTGVGAVGMYVVEAIIKRIGEADQSLIFWYLPFLIIGVIGVGVGLPLMIIGIKRLREKADEEKTLEE